jgi:hypothetical protein
MTDIWVGGMRKVGAIKCQPSSCCSPEQHAVEHTDD